MTIYIPPHRRQDGPSNAPHQTQQGLSKMPNLDPLLRLEHRASLANKHRASSSSSRLLQAHGDSFVGPLTQLSNKLVDVRRYSGATAKGLDNDQSDKKVGQRLVTYLDETRPDKVLLQFGNVDINISSIYKLETQGDADWDEKRFVADVWNSYHTFLKSKILRRLVVEPGSLSSLASSSSSSPSPPSNNSGYIRDLYLCTTTLPIVGDEALPESHAKYQNTKRKRKNSQLQPSVEVAHEIEIQSRRLQRRVRLLLRLCGLEARRRMTADFNSRLGAFVDGFRDEFSYEGPARLHLVDLNQYIRKKSNSDEVAAQYITDDSTNLHVTWENTLPYWIQELASTGLHTSHMPPKRELEKQWATYAARKGKQMESIRQKRNGL